MSSVVRGVDLHLVDNLTVLTEDDLHDVKVAVLDVAYRWKHLGGALRLRNPELNYIQHSQRTPHDCLEEALCSWLQKKYDVQKFGPPTWRMLVRAVVEDAGGKSPTLAEQIATKHPCNGAPMDTESTAQATDHSHSFHQSMPQPTFQGTTHPYSHRQEPTPQPEVTSLYPQLPPLETPPPNLEPVPTGRMAVLSVAHTVDKSSTPGGNNWFPRDGERIETDGPGGKMTFDCYQPYQPAESAQSTSVRLSFTEAVGIDRREKHEHNAYPLRCYPHGIAVIINNEQFDNMSKREGTEIDEGNLIKTFRYLGYVVWVYRNCTSVQMIGIFETMRLRSHHDYDSFVCCILTHGQEGHIYSSDNESIKLEDLTTKLSARNCETLAGKPKMFFIQACRGKIKDPAARIACDSPRPRIERDGGGQTLDVPNEADFIFSYATPSGQACFRDLDCGSWYISELCKVLCRSSTFLHLDDMLKEVHVSVGKYEYQTYRQVPEVVQRLHHNIYFF